MKKKIEIFLFANEILENGIAKALILVNTEILLIRFLREFQSFEDSYDLTFYIIAHHHYFEEIEDLMQSLGFQIIMIPTSHYDCNANIIYQIIRDNTIHDGPCLFLHLTFPLLSPSYFFDMIESSVNRPTMMVAECSKMKNLQAEETQYIKITSGKAMLCKSKQLHCFLFTTVIQGSILKTVFNIVYPWIFPYYHLIYFRVYEIQNYLYLDELQPIKTLNDVQSIENILLQKQIHTLTFQLHNLWKKVLFLEKKLKNKN